MIHGSKLDPSSKKKKKACSCCLRAGDSELGMQREKKNSLGYGSVDVGGVFFFFSQMCFPVSFYLCDASDFAE